MRAKVREGSPEGSFEPACERGINAADVCGSETDEYDQQQPSAGISNCPSIDAHLTVNAYIAKDYVRDSYRVKIEIRNATEAV